MLALLSLLALGCAASVKTYTSASPLPLGEVDVDAWDRLLAAHVRDGDVDYPAFCDSPDFDAYLEDLERASLDGAPREEQLGFLIDSYNAHAIGSILQGLRPGTLLGRYTFFLRERHPVAGEEITLFDLERERLKAFDDPRIHFAISCASASCPKLRSSAFHAADLDVRLDAAAREFVNDSTRNRFDLEAGVAELSAIFDWYRDEFEDEAGSLERYVASHVMHAETADALRAGRLKLEFLEYDWSLNGAPPSGEDGACPVQ